MSDFISVWIKFFFLFTPFSAVSMFLSLTNGYSAKERNQLVKQIAISISIICFVLYFFGSHIFAIFGITLDAFRVGAGALLFLSAVNLIQNRSETPKPTQKQDIAVVPMAMPIIIGPATIGTLLVMSAENTETIQIVQSNVALLAAIICVTGMLRLSTEFEKRLGQRGLSILTKLSGLILSALAAQMILTGILDFFAK